MDKLKILLMGFMAGNLLGIHLTIYEIAKTLKALLP